MDVYAPGDKAGLWQVQRQNLPNAQKKGFEERDLLCVIEQQQAVLLIAIMKG